MMRLNVHLDKASPKWKGAFPRLKDKVEYAAAFAFLKAKKPTAFSRRNFEINILLADDKTVKTLNNDYRGKNKPTNVLSFPQINLQKFKRTSLDSFPTGINIPLGDVVLGLEIIKKEARDQAKSLEQHVIHLIVHGVLHLLGYDHMRLKDAKAMEKLECDILRQLGYPDPYHENKLKHG